MENIIVKKKKKSPYFYRAYLPHFDANLVLLKFYSLDLDSTEDKVYDESIFISRFWITTLNLNEFQRKKSSTKIFCQAVYFSFLLSQRSAAHQKLMHVASGYSRWEVLETFI